MRCVCVCFHACCVRRVSVFLIVCVLFLFGMLVCRVFVLIVCVCNPAFILYLIAVRKHVGDKVHYTILRDGEKLEVVSTVRHLSTHSLARPYYIHTHAHSLTHTLATHAHIRSTRKGNPRTIP